MANNKNKKIKEKEPLQTITVEQLECNRCGYRWYPRISREGETVIPMSCANILCKSPYWNKERVFPKKEKK